MIKFLLGALVGGIVMMIAMACIFAGKDGSEMTEKDRLVELLKSSSQYICEQDSLTETIADYLLNNGIIVTPVKVGQMVWRVDDCIECVAVDKVVIKYGGIYMKLSCNSMYETSCRSIGKTVFLTQEEAERELERRNGND